MFATYATSLFASARKASPRWEGKQTGERNEVKVSIDAWESPPHGVDSEEANSG